MKRILIALAILAAPFLIPLAATAADIGPIANPVIDHVQGTLVGWAADAAVTAFFTAAAWFGGLIGVRIVERLNRQTLQEAATRYANSIIDQLQARYIGSTDPNIGDLVGAGIGYIKAGNPGTVKQTKATDDRLGTYVRSAIQQVKADKLADALKRAGAM